MKCIYVKLFDKGGLDDRLYLYCLQDPNKNTIERLDLRQDLTTKEWYTSLEDIGRKGAELISVSPYEKEKTDSKVIIKNIYIVKIEK